MLKREGKVYTVVVENAKTDTLLPVIKRKIMPDSIVYTDYYHSYNVLDVGELKHFRINHSPHFSKRKIILIGLKISEIRLKECLENITELIRNPFRYS